MSEIHRKSANQDAMMKKLEEQYRIQEEKLKEKKGVNTKEELLAISSQSIKDHQSKMPRESVGTKRIINPVSPAIAEAKQKVAEEIERTREATKQAFKTIKEENR